MQDAPLQQAPIADSAQVDVSIDDATFSPYLPVAQIPKLPTGVALSFFFCQSLMARCCVQMARNSGDF